MSSSQADLQGVKTWQKDYGNSATNWLVLLGKTEMAVEKSTNLYVSRHIHAYFSVRVVCVFQSVGVSEKLNVKIQLTGFE